MSEITKNEGMEMEMPKDLITDDLAGATEEVEQRKPVDLDLDTLRAISNDMPDEEETNSEAQEITDELQRALKECNVPKAVIQEDKIRDISNAEYIDDDFNHTMNTLRPDDKKRMEWAKVKRLAQRNEIVDCRVLGAARIGNAVYFTTFIHGFKAVILAEDFFLPGTFDATTFDNAPREEQLTRYMQMGQRMFNARIKVIITHAVFSYENQKRNYIVRANRVLAAEVMKRLFFFNDDSRSRIRQVKEGSNIAVRILAVAPHRIRVEACGVESLVDFGALSARQVVTEENCSSLFPKDRAVYMRVMKLEKDPKTGTVEMELSHKAIEKENYSTEISSDMVGQRFLGTIISVLPEYYIAMIEQNGCRCVIPSRKYFDMNRLNVMDTVSINITGITEKGNAFTGECRRV